MKYFQVRLNRFGRTAALIFLFSAFAGSGSPIYAHGGEDHGAGQPKTTASDAGTVLRTSRLGDLEVTLKHPLFAPDAATPARLFITKFETNEAFENVNPSIEIESANGTVLQAAIEKSLRAGSFEVKFPALEQGTYTIRAKLTYDGETDTATFSGVNVAPAPSALPESGEATGWARILLMTFVFLIVLLLFGGLIYFVSRISGAQKSDSINEKTVSA